MVWPVQWCIAVPWPAPRTRSRWSDDGLDAPVTLILSSPTNPAPAAPQGRFRTTVARLGRALRSRRAEPDAVAIRRLVPSILERLAERHPDARGWTIVRVQAGEPGVVFVGPSATAVTAVLRIARTAGGARGLDRADAALSAIPALVPEAAPILPSVLGGATDGGVRWLAERSLPGTSGSTRGQDADRRRATVAAIVAAIAPIHAASAAIRVDADRTRGWVADRAAVVAEAVRSEPARSEAVDRLAGDLAGRLIGRELAVGWIHGDLWAANVLVDGRGAVTGIVDWDTAAPAEPALHDRLHLALTTRRRAERRHLGPLLAELLETGRWADEDRPALGLGPTDLVDGDTPVASLGGLDAITALQLYWLRFVEANLARHPGLAHDVAWRRANLDRVIACL